MVDSQHRQIPGYRDLSQETIDLMKEIKAAEARLAEIWTHVKQKAPDADGRDLAMARTHFEDGFIRLVRAVARPDSPWSPVAQDGPPRPPVSGGGS